MSTAYLLKQTLLQLVYGETIGFQSIQIKNWVTYNCIYEA